MNHKRIIASPSFRVFLEKERLHFLWFSHKLHQIIFHFPDTALIYVLLVWQRAAVFEWNQTSGGKQSRERHKYKIMIANNHQPSRMLYSSKALDRNPGGLWQNPCLGLQYQSGPSFIHRLQILTDRAQGRRNLCKYCCDYRQRFTPKITLVLITTTSCCSSNCPTKTRVKDTVNTSGAWWQSSGMFLPWSV